jgi:hypothetical protein
VDGVCEKAGDKPLDADTSPPAAFNIPPRKAGLRHVSMTTPNHHLKIVPEWKYYTP